MKTDMHRLIGKYISGNTTQEEQQQLQNWLAADPEHRSELEKAEKLWAVAGNLKKSRPHNAETAWQDFQVRAARAPKVRALSFSTSWKLAAGLALAVGLVFLVRFFLSDSNDNKLVMREQIQVLTFEHAAPAAEKIADSFPATAIAPKMRKAAKPANLLAMTSVSTNDSAGIFLLPDGSKVYLNAHSRLQFSESGRNLLLDGEAFFEVKADTLPFYITCKNTVTRALGNSFNVKGYADNNRVEVMAVSGEVEVWDRTAINKLVLKAGETAATSDSQSFVKSKTGKKERWWKRSGLRSKIKSFLNKLRGKSD